MWPLENCTLVGVLLFLLLWLGHSEATGKKIVDTITRTEGERLTDVMNCVE